MLFITHAKLLAQLHPARATDAYERKPKPKPKQLAGIDLLVLDDFGLRPMRSPQDEDFHDLIAERYERSAIIVTSNLDVGEWGAAFPNKLLGAATIDRLRDGAYRVILDGESRRRLTGTTLASSAPKLGSFATASATVRSARCAWCLAVIRVSACPSKVAIVRSGTPACARWDANVCRSSWNRTAGATFAALQATRRARA